MLNLATIKKRISQSVVEGSRANFLTNLSVGVRKDHCFRFNRVYKYLSLALFVMIMTSCASRKIDPKPLAFPADMNQPFLTLEHIPGEDVVPPHGLLGRIMSRITGRQSAMPIARPSAVAITSSGDIYVVDTDAAHILRYRYNQNALESVEIFAPSELKSPLGIAVTSEKIYISDAESKLIHLFTHKFKSLGSLNIEGLERPGQLKINPLTNELFIVDTPAHQIIVVDDQGSVIKRLNNETLRRETFKAPIAVDFTLEGNIVVLDGLSRRVEFLSPEYKYLYGFGGYDRVPGSFSYPRGLAISSDGYVFVSDAAFGNIQIFDPKGALLYFWGETGQEAGEFLLPAALNFDAQNNLYVVDQYNNRVQVFQYYAQGR